MAFKFHLHIITADWHERPMPVAPEPSGGERGITLMVRAHRLIYEPFTASDELRLKSLAGKINAKPFLGCSAELLLCVNSDWLIDTEHLRKEFLPPDDSERPEFDSAPNEWAVVLYERAQLGWNETFAPAGDGGSKVRRVRRENYGAVDFAEVLDEAE
jgi:hypothetical protein